MIKQNEIPVKKVLEVIQNPIKFTYFNYFW